MGREKWGQWGDQAWYGQGPFNLAAARGLVQHSQSDHKFGTNAAVGTSRETIWTESGMYVYSTADVLTVTSTSTADSDTEVGARTIELIGLDTDYNQLTTTINMKGQSTAGATLSIFERFLRGIVRGVGSSGENIGTIRIGTGAVVAGVPANVWGRIEPGLGQTQMAMVTVPDGFKAYVWSVYLHVAAQRFVSAFLMARPPDEAWQVKWETDQLGGAHMHPFNFPLEFAEKTDLQMQGQASTANTEVSAGFDYLLVRQTTN